MSPISAKKNRERRKVKNLIESDFFAASKLLPRELVKVPGSRIRTRVKEEETIRLNGDPPPPPLERRGPSVNQKLWEGNSIRGNQVLLIKKDGMIF